MNKNVTRYEKLIFLLVDGVPFSVFNSLLQKGLLPNTDKHIIKRGCLKKAVSVFPSTTGPAYIPLFMGMMPGEANLPGIRWLSKKNYIKVSKYKSPGICSYLGPESFLFNEHIPNDKKTIFEYFPKNSNIFNMLTRGCTNDRVKHSKLFHYAYSYLLSRWDHADRVATRHMLKAVDEGDDLIVCLYPGIDEFGHHFGITSGKTIKEYINVDQGIGKLFDLLKKKGLYDKTLVVLSSDHGLTDTHTHIDVSGHLNKKGLRCLEYPVLWKKDPVCASMVSGNGMINLYIKNPDGNGAWGPRLEMDKCKELGYVSALLELKGIDFIAGKTKNGVEVLSSKGKGLISNSSGIRYEYTGEDPLKYGRKIDVKDHEEALKETFNSYFPDGIVQLLQIFEAERSGDMVISASPGYDLRKRFEIKEHHATHGALNAEQMFIPFASNHDIEKEFVRSVDIFKFMKDLAIGEDTL